jgi:hypothetical protein
MFDQNKGSMDDQNINRSYNSKNNKSDFVNFPVLFRREALSVSENSELIQAPITAVRILFKILHDISHDQFQADKQKNQLNLFEEHFTTDNNSYCKFLFPIESIDENRNYNSVKKGLEFLEELNKGWYKVTNSKGKTVSSYGGVISNANIDEGNVFFLVSSYWIEKLLKIPKYNTVIYDLAWQLPKSKQILFYLWLLEVPETGTNVNFDKFQSSYGFNYSTPHSFCKNFLKNIKDILDQYSNVSFNYKVKSNKIHILPYPTKTINLKLNKKTIKKQEITQKLHYWKTRHKLDNKIDTIKTVINLDNSCFPILLKAYKNLVKDCRVAGTKVTDYTGESFMKVFQHHIKLHYQQSNWNTIVKDGYPRITESDFDPDLNA